VYQLQEDKRRAMAMPSTAGIAYLSLRCGSAAGLGATRPNDAFHKFNDLPELVFVELIHRHAPHQPHKIGVLLALVLHQGAIA